MILNLDGVSYIPIYFKQDLADLYEKVKRTCEMIKTGDEAWENKF